jgi:hypothetical protein
MWTRSGTRFSSFRLFLEEIVRQKLIFRRSFVFSTSPTSDAWGEGVETLEHKMLDWVGVDSDPNQRNSMATSKKCATMDMEF